MATDICDEGEQEINYAEYGWDFKEKQNGHSCTTYSN